MDVTIFGVIVCILATVYAIAVWLYTKQRTNQFNALSKKVHLKCMQLSKGWHDVFSACDKCRVIVWEEQLPDFPREIRLLPCERHNRRGDYVQPKEAAND